MCWVCCDFVRNFISFYISCLLIRSPTRERVAERNPIICQFSMMIEKQQRGIPLCIKARNIRWRWSGKPSRLCTTREEQKHNISLWRMKNVSAFTQLKWFPMKFQHISRRTSSTLSLNCLMYCTTITACRRCERKEIKIDFTAFHAAVCSIVSDDLWKLLTWQEELVRLIQALETHKTLLIFA